MTSHAKSAGTAVKVARSELDAEGVAEYLHAHPEFFENNAALVAALRLPHVRGDGSTISLVERQIEVLRERERLLELRLKSLIEIGHQNDQLAERIHRLARRLLRAHDAQARLAAIEASLREDFEAHEFVLVLFRRDSALAALESRSLRFVARDAAEMRGFDSLFTTARPRCGQVRDSSRDFLFPNSSLAVGSVALVPLGPGGELGLLCIASPDADHFNPTMSTDFLVRIGDLVATALA